MDNPPSAPSSFLRHNHHTQHTTAILHTSCVCSHNHHAAHYQWGAVAHVISGVGAVAHIDCHFPSGSHRPPLNPKHYHQGGAVAICLGQLPQQRAAANIDCEHVSSVQQRATAQRVEALHNHARHRVGKRGVGLGFRAELHRAGLRYSM